MVRNLEIGDVVVFPYEEKARISRIIAREGETYRFDKNLFHINDSGLQLGILNIKDIENLNVENSADLFYEENGSRKYPVRVFIEENQKTKKPALKKSRPVLIKPGRFLVSMDNRNKEDHYTVISYNNIIGRVEGILFGDNLYRLLLKPYLSE